MSDINKGRMQFYQSHSKALKRWIHILKNEHPTASELICRAELTQAEVNEIKKGKVFTPDHETLQRHISDILEECFILNMRLDDISKAA